MEFTGRQLDRYHLLRLLGFGGMGEVYLANSKGEFVNWSAPLGVTRENPASARVLGAGACDPGSGGAVGYGTYVYPTNKHFLSGSIIPKRQTIAALIWRAVKARGCTPPMRVWWSIPAGTITAMAT